MKISLTCIYVSPPIKSINLKVIWLDWDLNSRPLKQKHLWRALTNWAILIETIFQSFEHNRERKRESVLKEDSTFILSTLLLSLFSHSLLLSCRGGGCSSRTVYTYWAASSPPSVSLSDMPYHQKLIHLKKVLLKKVACAGDWTQDLPISSMCCYQLSYWNRQEFRPSFRALSVRKGERDDGRRLLKNKFWKRVQWNTGISKKKSFLNF